MAVKRGRSFGSLARVFYRFPFVTDFRYLVTFRQPCWAYDWGVIMPRLLFRIPQTLFWLLLAVLASFAMFIWIFVFSLILLVGAIEVEFYKFHKRPTNALARNAK